MTVSISTLVGQDMTGAIDDLSRLRIAVFADWPYLYAGDAKYEAEYLETFIQCERACIVAAYEANRMIGAATSAPLDGHTHSFAPLFSEHGYDPARVYYCGESVLLPEYRGQGIGHRFFDAREAHARALNDQMGTDGNQFTDIAFCGVVRSEQDPRRPPGYRPLDAFWIKRGYRPVDGMIGTYDWQEIGGNEEISHPMQFWIRTL